MCRITARYREHSSTAFPAALPSPCSNLPWASRNARTTSGGLLGRDLKREEKGNIVRPLPRRRHRQPRGTPLSNNTCLLPIWDVQIQVPWKWSLQAILLLLACWTSRPSTVYHLSGQDGGGNDDDGRALRPPPHSPSLWLVIETPPGAVRVISQPSPPPVPPRSAWETHSRARARCRDHRWPW